MHKKDLSPTNQELLDGKIIEGEFIPEALTKELIQMQDYAAKPSTKVNIQGSLIDFLLKLLLVLEEDIKPGSQLKVKLHLGRVKLGDFPLKVYKNYERLTYRFIIRGGWLFNLALAIFIIISYSNSLGKPFVQFLLYVGVPFYLFVGHLILMFVAERYFGEIDPKIKTHTRQVPRIMLQTQLADATQFELHISHWFIHKKAIGYRFHKTPLHSTRTKRKRKAKTVTTLKLAFAKKVYPLSEEKFAQKFKSNLQIDSVKVAKMKLKTGEKRNAVIYQDIHNKDGVTTPNIDFDRVLKLISIGGHRRLQQLLPEEYLWDDLTRIEGIDGEIATIFNRIGVFTFQQLMRLDGNEVDNKVDALRPRSYKYNHRYFYDHLDEWQAKVLSISQPGRDDH
ncbi:hypothetical protein BKI52_01235 [marine bacterium AO1-C]|nr:hypothetical protein BKI52_01235 [marine bacterium AO1-C]